MIRRHSLYLALTVPVVAATLFAGGLFVGLAAAGPGDQARAAAQPYPDWFLPIWDAYDRNPAITPEFDFASLYSGDLNPVPAGRR